MCQHPHILSGDVGDDLEMPPSNHLSAKDEDNSAMFSICRQASRFPSQTNSLNAMAPVSPRSSLLAHSDKLRSQTASWLVLWVGLLITIGLLALASERTTSPPGYLQGCSQHCTGNMPLVCQNQWSCDTFCTNGYFHANSIETRANGERYLAKNDGISCQSRCENIKSAVCQGRVSCESMCTILYQGLSTEPASKNSDPIWIENVAPYLLYLFLIADLLCTWLRLWSSFDFIRAQQDRKAADSSASELPRSEIDTKTFHCGIAIILRSVFELRALFGSDSFGATILCLLLVDEALQYDTQGLAAPQGVYVVSLFSRFLRAIVSAPRAAMAPPVSPEPRTSSQKAE